MLLCHLYHVMYCISESPSQGIAQRRGAIKMPKIHEAMGHKFIATFYKQPTFCSFCNEFLWWIQLFKLQSMLVIVIHDDTCRIYKLNWPSLVWPGQMCHKWFDLFVDLIQLIGFSSSLFIFSGVWINKDINVKVNLNFKIFLIKERMMVRGMNER